jgi:hypothetical protein
LHQGQPTDPAKLVDQTAPRNKGPIMDHHMAAQQGPVGQDIVVTQNTVVSDMGTRHQKVSVAEDRVFFHPIRAVHGDVFPKYIIVTDAESSGLAGVFEVLGCVSQNGPGMDSVA